MPMTRHGSGTPGRGGQIKQQKNAHGPSAQSNKSPAPRSDQSGAPKVTENVENVRSTRRSQPGPEPSGSTARRTRGTNVKPEQQEVVSSETKARKDSKEMQPTGVKQEEPLSTRSTRRIAASPKEVLMKKQRIVSVTAPSKAVEATDEVMEEHLKDETAKAEESIGKEKQDEFDKTDVRINTAEQHNDYKGQKEMKKDEIVREKGEKRKRSSTGVAGLAAEVDVLSPRRSSRAVVPNSRYKDMVDPGKKKSIIQTDVKKEVTAPAPKRKKVDYTTISVQQQGNLNEITEEIITEETKIDAFAQMNLMDEMLILPQNSAGTSETRPVISEPESSNVNSTGIKIIKLQDSKVIEYQAETEGIHILQCTSELQSDVLVHTSVETSDESREISGEMSIVDSKDRAESARINDDLLQSADMPEPHVIVIPSESGKHMNKIIIPKDPYRARLEQAFEKSGGSMVIGPSIGKSEAKKIIVTPTHQHVSKKEAQRSKIGVDKAQLESDLGKNLGKPNITSVIYPQMQKSGASTANVIHTGEKHVKYTMMPRIKDKDFSTIKEVNLHCDEDAEEMAGSNSGETDTGTVVASSVTTATVPNVKIVYVNAKQKPLSNVKSGINRKYLHASDEKKDEATSKQFQTLKNLNENKDKTIHEQFEEHESEIETNAVIENTNIVLREKDDSCSMESSKSLDIVELEEVTGVPVEQKLASSLCQVIEYKQQPQTAIEYVLLDNKMVPIHKPFQTGSHGRQGRQTQSVNRHTPGRVETGAQGEQSHVKKIPMYTTPSAVSKVMSQLGGGATLTVSSVISDQLGATEVVSGEADKTVAQPVRVIHGYIERPERSNSPTQIVEISTEAFNKEIYGEETTLDAVTGQIVSGTVVETSQVESIPAQTVSEQDPYTEMQSVEAVQQSSAEIENNQSIQTSVNQSVEVVTRYQPVDVGNRLSSEASVNQSVEDVTGYQPVNVGNDQSAETSVNQSVEGVTQSMEVNTDDGTTVIYTGNEGEQMEEISSWTVEMPVTSSDSGMVVTAPDSEVRDLSTNNVVHIEGLDQTQIPENATITVEKLASGGEIVIMQIKDTAVSETLEKLKPLRSEPSQTMSHVPVNKPASIVNARVLERPRQYTTNNAAVMKSPPVRKMSEVKITPVRAYEKSESHAGAGGSSAIADSKTMGTNTETSEEEEGVDYKSEDEEGFPVDESSIKKDNLYQEYIVVRLPEGTEVKRPYARPRKETKPLGEEVTMDNEGLYVCVDCGHKTENRGNWFKHRRKHLGIRPHACTKCSYRAATSSNLKRHMMIHDDIRNFQCAYCDTLFRQKIHLERHLKYKHEEKNVQCPLCDYVCSSENPDLKVHIKRRHMPNEGALNAFTCDVCGLMTVSKKDLKQHKKFHKNGPELKLFCEHCSFVTDCVSRLRRHMLIHTKERPFQCGLCTYRATQKEHVLRHMRSQHGVEVERNQRRSLLEKNYHNPEDILIAGIDQSSTSENKESPTEIDLGPFEKSDYSSTDKIFACNYCSMKFAKLINLYKHLYAQHKQVMPDEGPNAYQCVVCDFRTNNKKNLLVHMRKHNMQDHSPPTHVYSCVLCRYINPRRRNLFQHMKKKHGIEIIMKDDGLNCYVTLENAAAQVQGQSVKSSVMALSDIVTTQTMDDATQNLFIAESGEDNASFHTEKISIDNIIADEIESYVVTDSTGEGTIVSPQVSVSTFPHASVQEHEAAEAIEGLQALAEQAGILETQNIDNDMTTEIVSSAIEISSTEIMNEREVLTSRENMMATEGASGEQTAQATEGLELSPEQLNQLATGDYVEINGEVYKVEIAPDAS